MHWKKKDFATKVFWSNQKIWKTICKKVDLIGFHTCALIPENSIVPWFDLDASAVYAQPFAKQTRMRLVEWAHRCVMPTKQIRQSITDEIKLRIHLKCVKSSRKLEFHEFPMTRLINRYNLILCVCFILFRFVSFSSYSCVNIVAPKSVLFSDTNTSIEYFSLIVFNMKKKTKTNAIDRFKQLEIPWEKA